MARLLRIEIDPHFDKGHLHIAHHHRPVPLEPEDLVRLKAVATRRTAAELVAGRPHDEGREVPYTEQDLAELEAIVDERRRIFEATKEGQDATHTTHERIAGRELPRTPLTDGRAALAAHAANQAAKGGGT